TSWPRLRRAATMLLCQSRFPGKGSRSIAQKIRMESFAPGQEIGCDEGFQRCPESGDRIKAVRENREEVVVFAKKVVEVLKIGPRVNVAPAEFKLDKVDATAGEHGPRALKGREFMAFNVQL